ncbi:MAG: hypothetical protein NVSMB1_12370 [Polyangiales bacterium]
MERSFRLLWIAATATLSLAAASCGSASSDSGGSGSGNDSAIDDAQSAETASTDDTSLADDVTANDSIVADETPADGPSGDTPTQKADSSTTEAALDVGPLDGGKSPPLGNLWVTPYGTKDDDRGNGIAVDKFGDVLVAGYVNHTLVGFSSAAFLGKYAGATGALSWKVVAGGLLENYAFDVATDDAANVYFAGYFESEFTLAGGPTLTAGGTNPMFVAKLDTTGKHVWSKAFTPVPAATAVTLTQPNKIALDASKNLLIAGFETTFPSGKNSAFLKQLDPTGAELWTKRWPSASAWGVATDKDSNIYLAGEFVGSIDLGGGTLTTGSSSMIKGAIFLAKYATSGAHLWSKAYPTGGAPTKSRVAIDATGNVVLMSTLQGGKNGPDFGGGPLALAFADHTIVLAEFDSAGTHLWSNSYPKASAYGLTTDSLSNVVLTGVKDLASGTTCAGAPVTASGSLSIRKFDHLGKDIWCKTMPGDGFVTAAATDSSNNVLVTGTFSSGAAGPVDVGTGPLLSTVGTYDLFVAKYKP